MGREADIYGIVGERVIVTPGATLARFLFPIAGQNSWIVKNVDGGTLEILGATIGPGRTLPLSDLVSLSGTGYLMGFYEALTIEGPASFYLSCTGSTGTVMLLRGKSPGQ